MEKRTGKKLNLTKKQFIIAIAAVCGIALIIEGALLIRMFAKKRPAEDKRRTGVQNAKAPGSYEVKKYRVQDGERVLIRSEKEYLDKAGNVTYYYEWTSKNYYPDDEDAVDKTYEVLYTYDEKNRRLTMEWTSEELADPVKTEKGSETYEYVKDGDGETVICRKTDENGAISETEETKYNKDGQKVWHRITDNRENKVTLSDDRKYDQYGNLISRDYTTEGQVYAQVTYDEAERKATCKSSQASSTWEVYYDSSGRLTRIKEFDYYDKLYSTKEFRYSNDTTGICCGNAVYYAGLTEPVWERENDPQGRVTQVIWYMEEATLYWLYDWNVRDPMAPGRDVLKVSYYIVSPEKQLSPQDLFEEYCFLIGTPTEREERDWELRNGGDWPSCFDTSFGPWSYSTDYIFSDTEVHLELYSATKYYDNIPDSLNPVVESTFDEKGNLRSITDKRFGYEYREFDDHGNMIKDKSTSDYSSDEFEYEYTYY